MRKLIAVVVLLTVITGLHCGHKPGLSPERSDGIYYEIAWVDPEVLVTDSLFTLIRADRLDSFVVERPAPSRSPSIEFEVEFSGCSVAINLFEANGAFVQPLFVEQLDWGVYKLTLNLSLFDYQSLPPGKYSFRADVCGQTTVSSFWRE